MGDLKFILEGRSVLVFNMESLFICDLKFIDFIFDEIRLFKFSIFLMILCD